MLRRYRCLRDIIAEILSSLSSGGKRLSENSRTVRIPTDRCRRLVEFLAQRGLVSERSGVVELTEKGYTWLELYRRLTELCCTSNTNPNRR